MSDVLRLDSPTLVVLVGPAASGKTTWASSHFKSNEVVSSDRLRGLVGKGEWDQSASADAFDLLEQIVDMRLSRKLMTVIDTTGLQQEDRRRWAAKAKEAGMLSAAVAFSTPGELCRRRNRERRDPVPARVLDSQLRRSRQSMEELPTDGFDIVAAPQQEVATGAGSSQPIAEAAHRQEATPAALEFGLVISRFDWPADEMADRVSDIAIAAEDAGFGTIWVMDHLRQIPQIGRHWDPLLESYTTLAYLAAVTNSIKLGVLVTNVGFRNIAHLGKIVASLDVLSGGRVRCGLGAGWFEQEATAFGYDFPSPGRRLDALEDALQLLPLIWAPGGKEFRGKTVTVLEAMNYPRPLQERIPILVGGSGERRTLRLVAEYADACNLMGSPQQVAAKLEVLRQHCIDVGRRFEDIAVTHLGSALVGPDRASLSDSIDRLRPPNTSAADFAASANAGTVREQIGRFRSYVDVGVSEVMITPPVLSVGAVAAFRPVVEAFAD